MTERTYTADEVDDIVQSHVITEMTGVYWCSVSQKWEEA